MIKPKPAGKGSFELADYGDRSCHSEMPADKPHVNLLPDLLGVAQPSHDASAASWRKASIVQHCGAFGLRVRVTGLRRSD